MCGFFQDLGLLLGSELLNKWFLLSKLKSSLRKFYGRYYDHGYVSVVVSTFSSFFHS